MPIVEDLPTRTPAAQQLAREVTLLLPQLTVTQVAAEDKDVKLFQYQQTEKCRELLRSLLSELAKVCFKEKRP